LAEQILEWERQSKAEEEAFIQYAIEEYDAHLREMAERESSEIDPSPPLYESPPASGSSTGGGPVEIDFEEAFSLQQPMQMDAS
jgi:hypothetical protein